MAGVRGSQGLQSEVMRGLVVPPGSPPEKRPCSSVAGRRAELLTLGGSALLAIGVYFAIKERPSEPFS